MEHPGDFRQYNITKKEWVLDGETVLYGPFEDLASTIEESSPLLKIKVYLQEKAPKIMPLG